MTTMEVNPAKKMFPVQMMYPDDVLNNAEVILARGADGYYRPALLIEETRNPLNYLALFFNAKEGFYPVYKKPDAVMRVDPDYLIGKRIKCETSYGNVDLIVIEDENSSGDKFPTLFTAMDARKRLYIVRIDQVAVSHSTVMRMTSMRG